MKKNEIIELFIKHKGYLTSGELVGYKVHTSDIRNLVNQGRIERIKRGLYRLPQDELAEDEIFTYDYFDAAASVPNSIFCLRTALNYYGLTTYNLHEFDLAIPPSNRSTKIFTTQVRFYRFQEPFFSSHVENIKTSIFPIKMYNMERSICDAIRLRHIVGEDIAMEGLNTYIKRSKKDINKLLEIAKFCNVKHLVEPAVKAMIGF